MNRLIGAVVIALLSGCSSCGPAPAPNAIDLSAFCPNVVAGMEGFALQQTANCGQPITRDDLRHIVGTASSGFDACDGGIASILGPIQTSISAGHMAYDGQKAYQCRALGRASDGGIAAFVDGGLIAPCNGVLTGLVAANGSCTMTEECAGGDLYCKPSGPGSCGGSCVPRVSPSASCDPNSDLCATGLQCFSGDGGIGTCSPLGGPGSSCANGTICQGNLTCLSGQCVAPVIFGQPCQDTVDSRDCLGGTCQRVRDGGVGGTCGPTPNAGEPCDLTTTPTCAACETCAGPPDGGSLGTCIVRGRVGDVCHLSQDCVEFLYCQTALADGGFLDGGSCAVMPRPGEQCFVTPGSLGSTRGNCLYADTFCQRASAANVTGTCQPDPVLNQSCGTTVDLSSECQQGNCVLDGGPAGTCLNRPVQGQACGSAFGTCQAGLYCQSDAGDVCEPLPGAGQPCAPDATCNSTSYCLDDGGCAALFSPGTPCTQSSQCSTGTCDSATGVCAMTCNAEYSSNGTANLNTCSGCPGGYRDISVWLLFALVLGPKVARKGKRAH